MSEKYKVERVKESFGLNAVEVFQYTPGIALSRLSAKAIQGLTSATNQRPPSDEGVIQDVSRVTRMSQLNTQIFSELRFVDRQQYTKFVNGGEQEVILADFIPIDTCLFSVSQNKHIVKTQIQGLEGGGTIKEYISDGDYEVTIRGGIFGKNGQYPHEEVFNLTEYLRAPIALSIISDFLEQFEIFELVVESYSFKQQKGRQSEQLFELRCSSNVSNQLLL